MALLPQVLAELNAMLGATSTAGGSKEVKHIAWLAEQVGREAGQSITGSPFRAGMGLPFWISVVFEVYEVRAWVFSLQIFCQSFFSIPLLFSYLLLIITATGRIDYHDNHHHNITKKKFFFFFLFRAVPTAYGSAQARS